MANVKEVDIFVEDFNINALSNEAYTGVNNVPTGYKLMVSEPTYMDEGLLDHLYLMKQFLVGKQVNSTVKNKYFSDHDALKIRIQEKKTEKELIEI